MIDATEAQIARFMKHVDKLPNGCWFWTGARSRGKGNKKWYGTFWVSKTVGRVRAHRFACEAVGNKGPLPAGYDRDHKCCFSLCVNPECLEYVPKAVNQSRRLDRQRSERNMKDRCNICTRVLDDPAEPVKSRDCGGDCLECMAAAGDEDCQKALDEENDNA